VLYSLYQISPKKASKFSSFFYLAMRQGRSNSKMAGGVLLTARKRVDNRPAEDFVADCVLWLAIDSGHPQEP